MKPQGRNRGPYLVGDMEGLVELQTAQQHRELLAADARDKIAAAQRRRETGRDALQDAVPCPVTITVVDDFETVDIPQQHDQGGPTVS